jgi:hypothetical protein
MSRRILFSVGVSLVFCGAALVPSSDVLGQRVWVGDGGVRVRAPFVRVDVGPYGGVSVRAPFTAIDLPGRAYYYEPYYEPYPVVTEQRIIEPAFPTAAEFAAMGDAQLYERMLAIADSLNRRLSRFDTGETWQNYFRFPQDALASADPVVRRDALIKLLERFQKVTADPQYAMISRLPAFVAMDAALIEAVSRPESVPGTVNPPADVEELPVPSPAQRVPPKSQQLPPPEPPQQPIPPQRDGPFLRPR